MDAAVIRAMRKWPDVASVYGWLSLDRRGNWRIRTSAGTPSPEYEPARFGCPRYEFIGNAAFRAFIARNYLADERGCWFFQNGPQRVFVTLAYAPLVYRLEADALRDHCERDSGPCEAVWLDEEGSLVVKAANGVGLLDDRDLGGIADQLAEGVFRLGGTYLPVGGLSSEKLETRFGFVRKPRP